MPLSVAILGATNLIGKEIAETLGEREFPATEYFAVGPRKAMGREVSIGETTIRMLDQDEFDWSRADVCFLAGGEKSARKWGGRISAAGCIVIDVSGGFRMDPEIPLVAPEANADAIEGWRERRIISVPGGPAGQLAAILKPLHDRAGVRRVVATVMSSMASSGRAAMDELWSQTKNIYVNQAVEPEEFPKQIAFNLIPKVGDYLDDGSTDAEAALREELRKILNPDLDVACTVIHAPVFVGDAIAVHVELDQPLPANSARAMFRESPGLMVVDNREEETFVTPLDCVGDWATYVSRIRNDDTLPNGLAFWTVCDNLRKGAALNAVQLAEMLNARGAFADLVK